jgi:cephalosporin hydroxylase
MNARRTLAEIAASLHPQDVGTKPESIWRDYEPLLAPLAHLPLNILEVGVHNGVSIRTFATYFEKPRIVGLDLSLPAIDLSGYPSIALFECDQRDSARINTICARHMPDGIDIVIDDASHVGEYSLDTYRALFPHVKAGGLYVIEDWGTGYMPQWGDGSALVDRGLHDRAAGYARRITSHDYGMVGFVKSLIDEVGAGSVESLQVVGSFVALTKRA